MEVVEAAAAGVLVPGEQITNRGICWAAQSSPRKPLLFVARRQYILVLTDRRLLVFRRHRALAPSDLVIAKRYEAFTLEKVARSRPLMQVRLHASRGHRLVFEFRPRQRELAGELVARMTPRHSDVLYDETTLTDASPAPATHS